MIFVDSNIPMYLVGAPHPNKTAARRLLDRLISDRERLVTDAEVLQEILHRYIAIGRREAIQPAFDAILGIIDEVFPVDAATVERAKGVVYGMQRLSASAALHIAAMERQGVGRILTFDSGFDGLPGVERIRP